MSAKASASIIRIIRAYERRCNTAPLSMYWHFLEAHDELTHAFDVLVTPFGVFVEAV